MTVSRRYDEICNVREEKVQEPGLPSNVAPGYPDEEKRLRNWISK